jgi:phosphoglycolate phosphatase
MGSDVTLHCGVRYEHVAFDLDGTLADTRADLAAATNHVLRSFGLAEIPPRSVYALVGEGARRLVERALGPERAAWVDEGVGRFLDYYGAHLLDTTTLYPGVPDALDALAAKGIVLSILSNKPEGLSRTVLHGLGVIGRFRAIVGGDSLPTRKPHPAGLESLARLTVTPLDAMLLVGDSPVDVATAANAGTDFCGVAWGLDPDALRAAQPACVVASPGALVALVADGQSVRGARVSNVS